MFYTYVLEFSRETEPTEYVCISISNDIYTHICICVCVCVYIYIYICVCVCVCVCVYWLPLWLSSKESACNAGEASSITRLGRFPGGRNGNPLQYSCLENPMDKGAWQSTVHRVAKKSHMTETPEHAHTYIYKHMHTHLAS